MSLTLLRVKMYSYKDTIVGASLFSRLIWIIEFQGCLDVPVRVFNRWTSTNQVLPENHAVDNNIFALLCMGHPNDEIIRKI